jgi:GntR family transcriptional regulator/MocR family aminotransferase
MTISDERAPILYREIYNRIRSSISEGRLRAGDRLPSARAMAAEFNVARGTVDTAYALLSGEGFLVSRSRVGTIVAPTVPAPTAPKRRPEATPETVADPEDFFNALFAAPLPLTPGLPSFDLFPRTLWAQLVARQVRRIGVGGLSYPDPMGSAALREALVSYLAVARGVQCSAEQIVITGGYLSAVGLLCRTMVAPGAQVWVETPGYNFTRRALATVGAVPVSVPVDAEGLVVDEGVRASPRARMCVVAPSNQFPLGVSLSLPRRMALLEWAHRANAWIVEDDYTGEFRYDGWPLPALKSLDRQERVFYVGTFSKTMFPGLMLGYLVVPQSQLGRIRNEVRRLGGARPPLEQGVMAEFLSRGHFGRHIKHMRAAYQSRKAALASAVGETFGDRFPVRPSAGGLNLLLDINSGERDVDLEARAAAGGLRPLAMSVMGRDDFRPPGLVLGFANLPEAQAPAIVQRLDAALRRF